MIDFIIYIDRIMLQQIYRIYDTVEKRHRTGMLVNVNWHILKEQIVEGWQTIIVRVEDQDRYIIERCTWLYDKNKVLIYENDTIDLYNERSIVVWYRWKRILQCVDDEDMTHWTLWREDAKKAILAHYPR